MIKRPLNYAQGVVATTWKSLLHFSVASFDTLLPADDEEKAESENLKGDGELPAQVPSEVRSLPNFLA